MIHHVGKHIDFGILREPDVVSKCRLIHYGVGSCSDGPSNVFAFRKSVLSHWIDHDRRDSGFINEQVR
jgi:hypothetical protein